jgi:hypothetical protein
MTTRISPARFALSGIVLAAIGVTACAANVGEEAALTDDALGAACSFTVTQNTYDGPNYWGSIALKNGSSSVSGLTVDFDVPSGAHCTNDSVPSGATLSPLNGSGSSATTKASHCTFTFSGSLGAGVTKSFNYSTDSQTFHAASNVQVRAASCSGTVDAGAPPPHDAGTNVPDTSTGGGSGCNRPNLVWKTANKTNFTSYPDPGSAECIQYNGCAYEGEFAACNKTESKAWVKSHNIVSVFPNLHKASNGIPALALHDLCLKKGSSTIVVTVLDECADSDCSGCCTQNKGGKDELIDIESFTDARWGVDDGPIEWADLGPTASSGCN